MDGSQEIREIGSRLQLFVDDWLIDSSTGLRHQFHEPVRRERVLQIDQPWEMHWQGIDDALTDEARREQVRQDSYAGATALGYSTVVRDGDLFRLYYTWDRGSDPCPTGYAESSDGIHWSKPNLGHVEFLGSKANNLVWVGPRAWDFNVFLDKNPATKPEERYKALSGGPPLALASPDGLHWKKMSESPVITDGAFDSQNVAFWDEARGTYVAFYRDFYPGGFEAWKATKGVGVDGLPIRELRMTREIKRAESDDFLHWSTGEWLEYDDGLREHLYTNTIAPYFRAPNLLLGFPMRLVVDRKAVSTHPYSGVSDVILISSRNGRIFNRSGEAFLRPSLDPETWTERNMLTTWGILPTGPGEISLYWVEHFRHPSIHIRRGTLRTDGFASLEGGHGGGEMLTHPLTFEGHRLLLNYATSAAGSLQVEIQDSYGKPVPGFSIAESRQLYGNEIAHEFRWTGGQGLDDLAGTPIRLRFVLKDASLYSLQFVL